MKNKHTIFWKCHSFWAIKQYGAYWEQSKLMFLFDCVALKLIGISLSWYCFKSAVFLLLCSLQLSHRKKDSPFAAFFSLSKTFLMLLQCFFSVINGVKGGWTLQANVNGWHFDMALTRLHCAVTFPLKIFHSNGITDMILLVLCILILWGELRGRT